MCCSCRPSGSVEVQQDLLVLTLGTSRDGKEAGAVQSQLRQALDTALQEARGSAEPGKMDVRTGQFSLYPRHGKNGEIVGWQGRAEVVLEGLDFARITATAARMSTMAIAQTGFGLSKAERSRVERQAQSQAIENFRRAGQRPGAGFRLCRLQPARGGGEQQRQRPGPRPA